jgi:hypothetical protein
MRRLSDRRHAALGLGGIMHADGGVRAARHAALGGIVYAAEGVQLAVFAALSRSALDAAITSAVSSRLCSTPLAATAAVTAALPRSLWRRPHRSMSQPTPRRLRLTPHCSTRAHAVIRSDGDSLSRNCGSRLACCD